MLFRLRFVLVEISLRSRSFAAHSFDTVMNNAFVNVACKFDCMNKYCNSAQIDDPIVGITLNAF